MKEIRVLHYLNQFFGQVGGEEKANLPPELREGPVGPGLAFQAAFGEEARIVATVLCGDSYFNEQVEEAEATILKLVEEQEVDLVLCGPAFNAGRYGVACGAIAAAVFDKLGLPAVTGMYEENPGVDLYKSRTYIVPTRDSAAGMRDAVSKMVPLALKLARGEALGSAEEEGFMSQGVRKNYFADKRGSRRAVDMLLAKLAGEDFQTEFPMPDFDRVPPNPALADVAKARIALVTSGGIVPLGNPDHIESSSASRYGKYDLEGVADLTSETYETAHGGYDPVYANEDADRVLPVDILREFEEEGKIGSLSRYFYSTVGNGTAVASAEAFARDFSRELVEDGVDAVILTST